VSKHQRELKTLAPTTNKSHSGLILSYSANQLPWKGWCTFHPDSAFSGKANIVHMTCPIKT